ncbi:hypothetical protein GGS23DRAFT_66631 [Durotheca rogersii]|uniref:uncharacterized protein n=1 Tax=Durotheca rogersii TaxID=419775 RepID=UPI00221FAA0F|nr:uncharacterized protein GGS23DRAFT_66631 [Durotheca rogersii]KAI5862784.1 hypothetical protein GGS23DRAFT_66631 [Durotheca rogersii]
MADRPPPHLRPSSNSSRATRANTAGVRRNLFQSQLTRRPTPTPTGAPVSGSHAHPSSSASSASSSHHHNHHRRHNSGTNSNHSAADTLRLGDVDVLSDSDDIVIRDRNGDFQVGDPPTPPLDDPDEAAALDDAQENARERQKLAEAVKHHQINHNRAPAQPEEVLEALRASMRAKVAALAEDNWMYEPEEEQLRAQ